MKALNENRGRERLSLDRGWRFHLGDMPFPTVRGHRASYHHAKAGSAGGAAAASYDDSLWRTVNLPHDWAIEQPPNADENLAQGFRARGIGWYRRAFRLDECDNGRHLEMQFDGIATHCTVWVNGLLVHRNWCGYTSFKIDLTPFARYGDDLNHVAVRVDADAMEGWWYEGAGIYRHTWLVKRHQVHVVTDGIYINPRRVAPETWSVPVEVTLANAGTEPESILVGAVLLDQAGKEQARATGQVLIESLQETAASLMLQLVSPRLWSVDDPVLYTVRVTLEIAAATVDTVEIICGFRTLRFDADEGFFLNDQPLKIKGVCGHQDHAGVGVAIPDSLWGFRLETIKALGANAYRCAHNPSSTEFLDLCDRLGILVMAENRRFGTNAEERRELEWLVRRDRNHPSVFMWSVFNEEPMQGTETGRAMVRRMAALVKRLDASRPVTAAMNDGFFHSANVSQAVDVMGFNYQQAHYDRFHAARPRLPLLSSEDTSAFMTRGEYVTDPSGHVMDCYDDQKASWGATQRESWKAIATRGYLAGTFVWCGFDYRGEPTPFQWPSTSSSFGLLDLCGFPKTAFYIRQSQWLENCPVLQLVPHWNWAGHEGRPIKVMAITNADTVALFLNGVPLGEKRVDEYEMAAWTVDYAPGRLEAIATAAGKEVARCTIETTGQPTALRLVGERKTMTGDGQDCQPITVQAVDAAGRLVPTAKLAVEFDILGPGEIIGLGNGDPNCHEPDKGNQRSIYNGLAQVIVQTAHQASGLIVLRAKSAALTPAEVSFEVAAPAVDAFVPAVRSTLTLRHWLKSPVTAAPPDPMRALADHDMNTWENIQTGQLQIYPDGGWTNYRAQLEPFADICRSGGRLVFTSIRGKAKAWVDQTRAGEKTGFEDGPLTVLLPSGHGPRHISILIQTASGEAAGLGGMVFADANQIETTGGV